MFQSNPAVKTGQTGQIRLIRPLEKLSSEKWFHVRVIICIEGKKRENLPIRFLDISR